MFEFAEIKNGIATVNINRPEAMNALNGTVVEQLGALVDNLNKDSTIHTIVLEGAGKAFVAGADVKFFVDRLDENAFPKIMNLQKDMFWQKSRTVQRPQSLLPLDLHWVEG